MGWRFRRSFKILPGIRLNLGKKGISATIGGKGLSVNLSKRGVYSTTSIPGTGISYRSRLENSSGGGHPSVLTHTSKRAPESPSPYAAPTTADQLVRDNTELEQLTSSSMTYLRDLIMETCATKRQLKQRVENLTEAISSINTELQRLKSGIFTRLMRSSKISDLEAHAMLLSADRDEAQVQHGNSAVKIECPLEQPASSLYEGLRDTFAVLSTCQGIWNITAQKTENNTRAQAPKSVERMKTDCDVKSVESIDCGFPGFHLRNRHGADLYLYPSFILLKAIYDRYGVIDWKDIRISYEETAFLETGAVPADTSCVGQTWAVTNNDGSPDRRCSTNPEIPIVRYSELTFTTSAGVHCVFMFSSPEKTKPFFEQFQTYQGLFAVS